MQLISKHKYSAYILIEQKINTEELIKLNITMMRDEIRSHLGVSDSGLKAIINRGTLRERLEKIGINLVKTYKLGRNTMYEVQLVELSYWDKVQVCYNIKKTNEHDKYTVARLSNDGVLDPRAKIIRDNNISISGDTAKRYDDILESEGYIMKDKTVYAYYNKSTRDFKEISEQEYKSFWKDVSYCKELMYENRRKLNKYEINQDTYDYRNFTILDSVGKEKGEIAMKFGTYKEMKDTQELVDMIKNRQILKK